MMVTELAATVVLLLADALAFRHSLRERPRNAMFWVVVAMGTVVGGYLSFGLVWQTKTTRFYGAPVTAAVLQLSENGVWQDYVGPLTVPAMLINFAVGFLLPHLPLWVRARLRARVTAG